MAHQYTDFSPLLQLLRTHEFEILARRHHRGRKLRRMSRWSQFLALATAQLTDRISLRDIVGNVAPQPRKLYHLGCRPVTRSSLVRVNEQQPAGLYEAVFGKLLERCQAASPSQGLRYKAKLLSLDASLIELILSLFPWARYQASKGEMKLQLGLDQGGDLSTFVHVSEGGRHEDN